MTRIYSGTVASALVTIALLLAGGPARTAPAAVVPVEVTAKPVAQTQLTIPAEKPHQIADDSTRRLDRLGLRVIRKPQSRPPERIGELC